MGQLWLRRDGAYLRVRRMIPASVPWPLRQQDHDALSAEALEVLAEYRWLDEQVRVQRHQLRALAGASSA